MQRQKTDNTLFTEAQLFKHRMLNLYKGLERIVMTIDENVSGMERAKCAEIVANIAIDVLKMESEMIYAVRNLAAKNIQGKNILEKLHHQNSN